MATLHGKNAAVYLQGANAEAEVISEAAEWSIDLDFDLDPDFALGDVWETAVQGIKRWSGSLSGNFDNAAEVPYDAFDAAAVRKFYLYPDRGTTTQYYYGTCWAKLSVAGGGGGRATFTSAIQGDGEFAKKP